MRTSAYFELLSGLKISTHGAARKFDLNEAKITGYDVSEIVSAPGASRKGHLE